MLQFNLHVAVRTTYGNLCRNKRRKVPYNLHYGLFTTSDLRVENTICASQKYVIKVAIELKY